MTGVVAWVVLVQLPETVGATGSPTGTRKFFVVRIVLGQIATLALIAGGATLITGDPVGLGALTVGMLFCTLSAVLDSWVLLVEILR